MRWRRRETPKGSDEQRRVGLAACSPLAVVAVVVAGYLAAQVVGSIVVALYPHVRGWNTAQADAWLNNSIAAQFTYMVLSEGLVLAIVAWFVRWRSIVWTELGLKRPRPVDIGYAALGFGAYFLLYAAATGLAEVFTRINVNQAQDVGFQNAAGLLGLCMAFISLVLLPPFVEELTFRGLLFGSLRQRVSFGTAALTTSALFAAPHLLESTGGGLLWIAGLDTFVLSLVLCFLREKTGRLWAGMGVHALKNLVAFTTLFMLHAR